MLMIRILPSYDEKQAYFFICIIIEVIGEGIYIFLTMFAFI